ncbi:RNA polymerase sigma factor [Polaribacter sp. Hel1_85]|uniref:RNA polymerase sigma factor n=1 Tax=Polaribacter sp. Hel1_85 TaxID=1250005 RepID=UPI00052CADD4|nr:sigma-70 family RNA polymerase sigma factor [Polaribacter sp. Hel1_85]KGL62624.1 RNA polymerase sigma-70 factor [Polaribacter sp. Hel1_85]
MSEHQLILLLKESDKEALKMVYIENRIPFINFARKFKVSENDIVDAYQDAIIVLSEKAFKGEIDNLNCSVKTYLFGIGKYILFEKARKTQKKVLDFPLEKEDYNYKSIAEDFFEEAPNKLELLLQKGFASLGKKCKEVLRLFYYRGFTIDEISDRLGYKDKNVVKSQKSRCIKQLKEKINN